MDPDLLTVVLASASCGAFCLVILMLAVVLYRKDPLCCRFRPHRTPDYVRNSPHSHRSPPLDNITHHPLGTTWNQSATVAQVPGGLFVIGKPDDYHLDGPPPRLPSYESVRRTDRQRHIITMIAQRFGLDGVRDEPPPTYEDTLGSSLSSTHVPSLDLHMSLHNHNDQLNLSEDQWNVDQPTSLWAGRGPEPRSTTRVDQNPGPRSTAAQEPASPVRPPRRFGPLII